MSAILSEGVGHRPVSVTIRSSRIGLGTAAIASGLTALSTAMVLSAPAVGNGIGSWLTNSVLMLLPWLISLLFARIALVATGGWRYRDGALAASVWKGFFLTFAWSAAAACGAKAYGWTLDVLRPALFGTVLETLPSILGSTGATLAALALGRTLHNLPRWSAAARIRGHMPEAVARETLALGASWLLTLALLDASLVSAVRESLGVPTAPVSTADDLVIALVSTAAYGFARSATFLFVTGNSALWLVIPNGALHERALIAADALAAEWPNGSVTLVSPASSPGRGEHIFLADGAGVLSALFPAKEYELGSWSSALPVAARWQALHHRELYPTDALLPRAVERFLGAEDIVVLICADGRSLAPWAGKLPPARTLIVTLGAGVYPDTGQLSDFATVSIGDTKSQIRRDCKGLVESRLRSPLYRRYQPASDVAASAETESAAEVEKAAQPQSATAASSGLLDRNGNPAALKEHRNRVTDDSLRIGVGVTPPDLQMLVDELLDELSRVTGCSVYRVDPNALVDARALDRTLARLDVLILPFNSAPQMAPTIGNGHLRMQSQSWERASSDPERERRLLWLDLQDLAPAKIEATQDELVLLRSVRMNAMRQSEVLEIVRQLAQPTRLFLVFAPEESQFVEPLSRRLQSVWRELVQQLEIGSPPVLQLRAMPISDASDRALRIRTNDACILLTGMRDKLNSLPLLRTVHDLVRGSSGRSLIAQVAPTGEPVEWMTEVGFAAVRFDLRHGELIEDVESLRTLRRSLTQLLAGEAGDRRAQLLAKMESIPSGSYAAESGQWANPGTPSPAKAPAEVWLHVSYCHDYRTYAEGLIEALRASGFMVAFDREARASEDLQERLDATIAEASGVIALVGTATLRRPEALREIDRAVAMGKKIVPIWVDDVPDVSGLIHLESANYTPRMGRTILLKDVAAGELKREFAEIVKRVAQIVTSSRPISYDGMQVQNPLAHFQTITSQKLQRIRNTLELAMQEPDPGHINRMAVSSELKPRLRLMLADLLHYIKTDRVSGDWPYQFIANTSTANWQGFALAKSHVSGVEGYVGCLLVTTPDSRERTAALVSYVVDSERTPIGVLVGDLICHVGPLDVGELLAIERSEAADRQLP